MQTESQVLSVINIWSHLIIVRVVWLGFGATTRRRSSVSTPGSRVLAYGGFLSSKSLAFEALIFSAFNWNLNLFTLGLQCLPLERVDVLTV